MLTSLTRTLTLLLAAGSVLGAAIPAGDSEDPARGAKYRPLPSLREQDTLEREWVQKRWDAVPGILKKHGYDAWILTMREYAEDTAFRALVPTTSTFAARRRTLFLFHSLPPSADYPPSPIVLIDNTDHLWHTLNRTLFALDPRTIALNTDVAVAFADGLHSGEQHALLHGIHGKYRKRLNACRDIAVEVIAARVGGASQLEQYTRMQENVWAMIAEGFSTAAITVGVTTPTDLEWWFRDTIRWRLGATTWFHPSVDIVRAPSEPSVAAHPQFREGDVVHVDIGITAMGMNTDTQHLAYILRRNETAAPAGLRDGLHDANRMQDMVRAQMVPGRTGNAVLEEVFTVMDKDGVDGDVYSHPIGDYGHSAGAVIGMTNLQGYVPDLGEMRVLEDYWTSVELAARRYVPEWGTVVRFELEEDVYWNRETKTFEWVFGQQTQFHLIQPLKKVATDNDGGLLEWVRASRWWSQLYW